MADKQPSIIRILPYCYIYVQDINTNVTRLEVGPQSFTRKDHERVSAGPLQMVIVPPRNYCVILNPVTRNADGTVVVDKFGQAVLRNSDEEIRFHQDPFPLYPGEKVVGKVTPLTVVSPNTALRLSCTREFTEEIDGKEYSRIPGDEWLFYGPGTYIPRIEVEVLEVLNATIIKPNQALRLRARRQCIDVNGNKRNDGEEWLVRSEGAYLPQVDEEVVRAVDAFVLTDKTALHLRSMRTFTDVFGKVRKAGEEWLVTLNDAETHIPDVYEVVVREVKVTTLSLHQFCYILNPVDEKGQPRLGARELRRGELSFFLQPGEILESGIEDIYLLSEQEALLLKAREAFEEIITTKEGETKNARSPGDLWMIYGPCEYVPPTTVEIIEKRQAIPLDENEGIYVRNIATGKVRSVVGQTYMLEPNEVLYEKELSPVVEELLQRTLDPLAGRGDRGQTRTTQRDKTRVVTFRCPYNAVSQVYDYKDKTSRTIFGPDLVSLGPEEQFTVLSLSGSKPKKPNVIKSVALLLGPDFMTDVIVVETADHARLSLCLSYNWHFSVDKTKPEECLCFQVPDFVGDACKAIASRIRAAVAVVTFDVFHRGSASIIRQAVFGLDEKGKVRCDFRFPANGLVITNIDIQSVEPVDQRTRDSLQKSIQLAIEITTNSQEAAARHEAERIEQKARGLLEKQKIEDESQSELARQGLLKLQADSAAVESTGQAKADALARAEAATIEGETAVKLGRLRAEAAKVEHDAEIEYQRQIQDNEIAHQKAIIDLEVSKARDLASIDAGKFKQIIDAIGPDTITAIAKAGPETQAQLLQGLGLNGYLITDGKSPINLLNVGQGLLGNMAQNAINTTPTDA
eukprot:GCRY01000340.1.p1 GENE.GCRY01000340.1~~GCRY01000340.1.p1  ORF type:complete len:857 (+),score=191.78 GCRY01000340.1:111-2681(+)